VALDRETYKQVKIIAINKFHDLSLLHIEDKNAPKFKPSRSQRGRVSVGDGVFAIGSRSASKHGDAGILSTRRPVEGELYLQTTRRSIPPATAAGPLFNLAGESSA